MMIAIMITIIIMTTTTTTTTTTPNSEYYDMIIIIIHNTPCVTLNIPLIPLLQCNIVTLYVVV